MSAESFILIEYIVGDTTFTLAAPGQFFSSLPRIEAEQDLFEADGYAAAEAFFKPLGGAIATVSFTIEEDFTLFDDALGAFQAAGSSVITEAGILRFTIEDDVTEWSNAVIGSVTPGLPFGSQATLSTEFQILIPAVPDEGGPA